MSIRLMSAVWDMHGLPAHLKLVLLKLADHANDEGYCRPGEDLLSLKVEQAPRTVRHNLDVLEAMGIVERTGRRSHSSREKRTMQYQLWIPTDTPDLVDWKTEAARAARAVKDPDDDWARPAGWYLPANRQPVAGQESEVLDDPAEVTDGDMHAGSGRSGRQSVAGLDPNANRQPSAGKPATQRAPTGNQLPVSIRNNHQEPSGTTTTRDTGPDGSPPELVTVTLARRWAELKQIPFEGARRSLVPSVIEAYAALRRDGIVVDAEFLEEAHRQGIRHPQGWWMAAANQANRPRACDRCGGRRQLAVLLDGRTVPFTDEDLIHDVGVDHPVPCECATVKAATG